MRYRGQATKAGKDGSAERILPLSLARAAGAVAAQAWMLSGEFQRKVVAMLVASAAVACDDNRQLQNASRAPDLGTGVPPNYSKDNVASTTKTDAVRSPYATLLNLCPVAIQKLLAGLDDPRLNQRRAHTGALDHKRRNGWSFSLPKAPYVA